MIERGEKLGLALEAREPIRIKCDRGGENLERDAAIQQGVASAIDFTHSAGAKRGLNFVSAEATTWCQPHRESPTIMHLRRRAGPPSDRRRVSSPHTRALVGERPAMDAPGAPESIEGASRP